MFNPVFTDAGRIAAAADNGQGLSTTITHVVLGSGSYAVRDDAGLPLSEGLNATALQDEQLRLPVYSGGSPGPGQLNLVAEVTKATGEDPTFYISEVGFLDADGVLVCVWSHPSKNLGYRGDLGNWYLSLGLAWVDLPSNQFTVEVQNAPLAEQSLKLAQLRGQVAEFVTQTGIEYSEDDQDALNRAMDQRLTDLADQLDQTVRAPLAVSPEQGSTDTLLAPELQSSPYFSADGYSHTASQFAVLNTDGSELHNSGELAAVESYQLPTQLLETLTDYRWKVRYQGTLGNDTVWSDWSEETAFTTADTYIGSPTILTPADGATGTELVLTLQASAFSVVPADADNHLSTDWQIATDAEFTNVVSESLDDSSNLISFSVSGLAINTQHFVRVRFKGATLIGSWSPVQSFTTTDQLIVAPSFSKVGIERLEATQFAAIPANGDSHTATDWQIATDMDFSQIEFESLNDSSNLTNIIPAGLQTETSYYARVRYQGAAFGNSEWSTAVHFIDRPNLAQDITRVPWEQFSSTGISTAQYQPIAKAGNTVIAVGYDGGARRSVDGGSTWEALPVGLSSDAIRHMMSVNTDGHGTWIVGMANGYAARSTDDGATWHSLPQNLHGIDTGSNDYIFGLATDGAGVWVAVHRNGTPARSTDNGATWQALPQGFGTGASDGIFTVATDQKGVWIACSAIGNVVRSTDNGLTWQPLPRFLNSGADQTQGVLGIDTDGKGTWVAGFQDGYAARSTDNGVTWSSLPRWLNNAGEIGDYINDIATDSQGNWVAALDSGHAAYSTDNGETWSSRKNILGTEADADIFGLSIGQDGKWLAIDQNGNIGKPVDNFSPAVGLLGGASSDSFYDVAVDRGNIFAVGNEKSSSGYYQALIAKFDASLNLLAQKNLGGSYDDNFYGIAIDSNGNIFAIGHERSSSNNNGILALITKYDSNLNLLAQVSLGDNTRNNYFKGVAIDSNDNVFAVGHEGSSDSSSQQALIAKFDSDLNLLAQKNLGGTNHDYFYAAAIDSSGNVFAAGSEGSSSSSSQQALIAKFDANLNLLAQVSLGDTTLSDYFRGVAIDSNDNVFAVGQENSSSSSFYQALITKFDANLNILAQKSLGGSNHDYFHAAAIDSSGNVYAVGNENSSAGSGYAEALVAKFDADLDLLAYKKLGGAGAANDYFRGVAIDGGGNVFVVGLEQSSDPGMYQAMIAAIPADVTNIESGALPDIPALAWGQPNLTEGTFSLLTGSPNLATGNPNLPTLNPGLNEGTPSLTATHSEY